jgi:ABC-2 type transport system permease protein
VVKTLLQLKLHLVFAGLKRSTARLVLWIIGLVYFAFLAVMLVVGLIFTRLEAAEHMDVTRTVTVAAGSVAVLAWILIPTLAFGADQTLDPARFVLFPVTGRKLAPGLTLASLVGGPGLLTVIVLVGGTLAVYSATGPAMLVAGLGAAAGVLMAVLCCRVPITYLSTSLTSRRGRDIMSLATVVLFVGGYIAYMMFTTSLGEGSGSRLEQIAERSTAIATVLAWTPLGAPWAWGADAAQGRWGWLGLHVGLTLAYLAVGVIAFGKLLDRALVNPAAPPSEGGVAKDDGIARWCARLPRALGGPAAAVTARCLLYYRRDPRYTGLLPLIVMFPILFVIIGRFTTGEGSIFPWAGSASAVFGCGMMAFMAGYALSNDIGSDATAWWTHLVTGVAGRADRIGRALAEATWCLPLIVVFGIAIPVFIGQPGKVLVSVGGMLALYGVSLGVAMVSSGLVVYPIALPGESVFAMKTASFGTQTVAQIATSLACCVVAAPVLVFAFLAPAGLGWLVLVVGVLWGAAALVGGIVWGGRVVDRRGPESMATLRKNDSRVRV